MRAAIYARMSTDKQVDASKSVPAPLDPRKRAFADATIPEPSAALVFVVGMVVAAAAARRLIA